MKRVAVFFIFLLMTFATAACSQPAEIASSMPPETQNSSVEIKAERVSFADPVLEAMVRATLGRPQGDITAAEAEAVTRLNLSVEWQRYLPGKQRIKEIGGLEYFKNLESLDLSFHEIRNIAPLAGLTKLHLLALGGNLISDIAPLAGLTNLQVLTLSDCAAQDYSPLAKLANLNFLTLENATLSDVQPLTSLKNLKSLYLAGCPTNNYYPLQSIYQGLEQKDFTVAFTLAELGFNKDDSSRQAIYDGESASVRINHSEWGDPSDEWTKNCVRTVFSQNGYKIDIGYYPAFETYVVLANKDGDWVMNYLYNRGKDLFSFGLGDRASSEERVRVTFNDANAENVLLVPIQRFHELLAQTLGIPVDKLFAMPFDKADDTLPTPYERLGFTYLDYKATCFYEEKTPHEWNLSVHRTEWDEKAPAENLVDWSMEFYDSDVNGYKLQILYYEAEGRYHVSVEKDGVEATFEALPATGERGWENPNLETVHRQFNEAFGTKDKELYDKPIDYFEQLVQACFGMSTKELYALPAN